MSVVEAHPRPGSWESGAHLSASGVVVRRGRNIARRRDVAVVSLAARGAGGPAAFGAHSLHCSRRIDPRSPRAQCGSHPFAVYCEQSNQQDMLLSSVLGGSSISNRLW